MATSRGSTTTKQRPTLEIVPDSRFVVFAGGEHEATTTKLTGFVRLHCPEAVSISKPRIRIEGRRKISWVNISSVSSSVVEDKRVFLNQERKLGRIESTHKVNAGVIEWPFEFDLSPQIPESVEGLSDSFIAYHLHASVSRSGWNQRDITTRAHIRVVRTLGSDSFETTRSRVNADIWANKLSYSISIPSDAIIFGTSITADVELSPIRKGIKLGRVEMKLIETVVKRISDGNDTPTQRADKAKSEESEVARTQMDFPESTKVTYDGETSDNPVVADEMYKFQATLKLPRSLHKCRQDVDSHQINITHRFKLMVNIHNPEGHVSQLVCRLPIKIFISPNLPIDESNEVHVSETTANAIGSSLVAPPQYGQHQLDQIFSDIDAADYMSRGGSGPNTPAGIFSQSRRGSEDNLRHLHTGIASSSSSSPIHGSAAPAVLMSRLSQIQTGEVAEYGDTGVGTSTRASNSNSNSPERASSQQRSPERQPSQSTTSSSGQTTDLTSQPTTANAGGVSQLTVMQPPYDMNDLSRVPSYNAAIRAPGPSTSISDHPPSYHAATSTPTTRPPSPQSRPHGTLRAASSPVIITSPSASAEPDSARTEITSPRASALPNTARTEDEARLTMLRAGS